MKALGLALLIGPVAVVICVASVWLLRADRAFGVAFVAMVLTMLAGGVLIAMAQ